MLPLAISIYSNDYEALDAEDFIIFRLVSEVSKLTILLVTLSESTYIPRFIPFIYLFTFEASP